MFEVSASTAIMIYLGTTLLTILGLWIVHHYKTKNRQIFSFPTKLFVCEYCHCVYQERAELQVTRCPQCHSLNKGSKPIE